MDLIWQPVLDIVDLTFKVLTLQSQLSQDIPKDNDTMMFHLPSAVFRENSVFTIAQNKVFFLIRKVLFFFF